MSGAWRGNAVRVSYINGIRTGEAECREHADRIGALFASPCYAFWNKTAVRSPCTSDFAARAGWCSNSIEHRD